MMFFLRSAPSTNSSVIKTLKRNSGLDAIAVQTCDDERAGMINTDNVVVGFNGQNIRLAKGQPLTITGENGSTYQCQLNLENGSGTIYVDKVNVKKLLWRNFGIRYVCQVVRKVGCIRILFN